MNAITDPADAALAPVHTLRCTGRKAVRFQGWQLVEAMGQSAGRSVWHDLNVYSTLSNKIVVELLVRTDSEDRPDTCRVKTFDNLEEASNWLEAYHPAEDLPIPEGLGAHDSPLPWTILEAVKLRMRMERLELDYRSLLSDVFSALDLTGRAECGSDLTTVCHEAVEGA